jgi:SAM-dependent methyltransferase
MALYRPLPFVTHILEKHIHRQARVIDATVGNGNDAATITRLLSHSGKFFGFDIQHEAIEQTTRRLATQHVQCTIDLFQQSHSTMLPILEQYIEKIDCVIFNLGYLPHADHHVTTIIQTTYTAILQALTLLKHKGLLIIVTYPGHDNGLIEHEQLRKLFTQANAANYFITTYRAVNNKRNPPHVFLIEKNHLRR